VADPVEVAPALRTSGSLAIRGRVSPVADPARLRALRQRSQAEALALHDAVRAALTTNGAVRLSAFGRIAPDAFAELLDLLAVGLDAPIGSDGVRRALSADGGVEVVLRDPQDGRVATIFTDGGVLRGPDLLVSISLVSSADEFDEAIGG
jgi:uncharacterized protein (TIGR02677 family)